jgi:predicted transcriptional regulator
MRHWILTTRVEVLAALHEYTFRHMHHLAAHIDRAYMGVRNNVMFLEKQGLLVTKKVRPVDADPTYKFTQIKLTTWGRKVARACYELKKASEEYEKTTHHGQADSPESD